MATKKAKVEATPVGTPAEEVQQLKEAVDVADKEVKEAVDAVETVVQEAGDVVESVVDTVKAELVEFEHFVENGTMTILDKVYEIKDFIVKVIPEHVKFAEYHGLKRK
jgi:prophage DNA circulation protein